MRGDGPHHSSGLQFDRMSQRIATHIAALNATAIIRP
jgi:hypothetical protein